MKIYIAKYMTYNIAISDDKEEVKEYIKKVRKLSKREYTIHSKEIPKSEIITYSERPEYISSINTKYYGMNMTNIDWYIIKRDFKTYVDDLITTRDTLKETYLTMSKVVSKEGMDSLRESLTEIENLIEDISNGCDVEIQYYKKHDIHRMSIISYLKYTDIYEGYYLDDLTKTY